MTQKKRTVKAKPVMDDIHTPLAPQVVVNNPQGQAVKKRVLHVGCGTYKPEKLHANFRGSDWQEVRMDIDPNVKPDIVSNMSKMDMVKDGEYDAIWSSHNIEHLYHHDVPVALKEFHRVIKMGGFVLITLPDMQSVAAFIAQGKLEKTLYESPAGPITPLDVVYGYTRSIASGNHFMAHKTGFTAETLAYKFHQAGFCNIQVQRKGYDLWAVAYKLPEGHEKRTDKANISFDRNTAAPEVLAAAELARISSGSPMDHLDRPPMMWKPLGLKKK